MLNKKIAIIPALVLSPFFLVSVAQAKTAFPTAPMYVALNEKNEAIEQIYRLTEQGNHWTVDIAKDAKGKAWQPLQCSRKPCRFTQTSYKTKLRFFRNSEPVQKVIKNQVKKMHLSCIDSPKLAICRLDETGKPPVFLNATSQGKLGVLTLMNKAHLQAYQPPQPTKQPLEKTPATGLASLEGSPFITVKDGKPNKILRFIPTQHFLQQQVFQQEKWQDVACKEKDNRACGFKPVAVEHVACLANGQGETLCRLHIGKQTVMFTWQKDANRAVERLYPADIAYPVPLPSLNAKGVFVSLDKQKNIQQAFKFFPAKAESNAEWQLQLLKNNQWETVNCGNNQPCRLKATDSATLQRLLNAGDSEEHRQLRLVLDQQVKHQQLQCAYITGMAFCRHLQTQGALKRSRYFFINAQGHILNLQRSE